MVMQPESEKACAKCARRRPLAEFVVGGVAGAPVRARFCLACRTTLKHCPRCGEDKPVCEFTYVSQRRIGGCKACYEALRERIYAGMRERHRALGVPAGASHYDQDPREVMLEPGRRRRARLRAAVREPIDRRVVFDRDGGICWLCDWPVVWEEATLDHVVPIAAGGADIPANVRLAHRSCNSRRGAPAVEIVSRGPARPGQLP